MAHPGVKTLSRYAFKFFLIAAVILCTRSNAQTVTNLQGFYRSGQVFLTWNKINNSTAFYKVYRSTLPIVSANDLASCEYLGYTNSASSINHNLTNHDGATHYLHLDSGGTALTSSAGLFVATTLANGSYYYAVTILTDTGENTSIVPNDNALSISITETVAMPEPVFQSGRIIDGVPVDIYTIFTSSKYTAGQPLLLNAGFLANDFVLNRNNATGNNPIRIFFHGGGGDYFTNIEVTNGDEIRINLEDFYPDSTIQSNWWGANPAFDVYNLDNDSINPTTGVNNNFVQLRAGSIIDWAIHHLPIDSNRIYISGVSAGAAGAYFYAVTYPDRIAAVSLELGVFNLSFMDDWQPDCPLNSGEKNRKDINKRLGTVATNLMCNSGIHTYDALNGGWVIHQYPTKDYPFIYSLNGKQDEETGWTEKTIYFDSVNANHLGGYYFWDNRQHSGMTGQTWSSNNFDLFRYHRNSSYPAFASCSLNEGFGDGNGNTGADYGTVNGSLDWNDNIIDNSQTWQVKVFVRDLLALQSVVISYPDSATADVTPRRLQNFSPSPGAEISWNVQHNGQTVQSGNFVYAGGLMIIPQAKIFKDTSIITLTITPAQTYYHDNDGDSFGNHTITIQAISQPNGYVSDSTDCNDSNSSINPGAIEVCNSVDDNCNGEIDEGGTTIFYADTDGDSYGNSNATTQACSAPGEYVSDNTDCNDANGDVHPGADDICNNIDDNCDGTVDENAVSVLIGASGPTSVCSPSTVTLNASVDGPVTSYQWYIYHEAIPDATGNSYTASVSGNYSVEAINSFCSAISSPVYVLIGQIPVATITPSGHLIVCNGPIITLNANTDAGWTYQWSKKGEVIDGATSSSFLTRKSEHGKFTVTISDVAGCSATSPATTIERILLPVPAISASDSLDICNIGQVELQANIDSDITYQWKKDGVFMTGATDQTYIAAATGHYRVKEANSQGCTRTSPAIQVTSSCKSNDAYAYSGRNEMLIQPVPTDGKFELVFKNFIQEDYAGEEGKPGTIYILDLEGRKVLETQVQISADLYWREFNLTGQLHDGIYFVEFLFNGMKEVKKLVVSTGTP